MIWLDITDPKYVLFFKSLIPLLETLDEVLITTRSSQNYDECLRLLNLFKIPYHQIGGYGGASKLGKLQARLTRQEGFLELFEKLGQIPKLFITGASVEGVQTAYGLGIPIVNFADTPLAGDHFCLEHLTLLSRLTLPLSNLIFHPFVVPQECYHCLAIPTKDIISYDFIDVALWLKDMSEGRDFRKTLGFDCSLPTILVREEEYKAHYVKQKLPVIYESIALLSSKLNANLVIIPRYGTEELKSLFSHQSNVVILEEKLEPKDFYPFIDLLIGGGGTMNLESCYLGIPTISTRSLFLFHDRYLLNHHLMHHATTAQEVLTLSLKLLCHFDPLAPRTLHPQIKLFEREPAGFTNIFAEIKKRFLAIPLR